MRRIVFTVAFAVVASAVLVLPAVASWASGGSTASPTSSSQTALQTQAQELAGQIQADGEQLDQLGESYNAAVIRMQQLATERAELERSMTRVASLVSTAKQALQEQALLAYLAGGGPVVTYNPSQPGTDPSLAAAYAEIVAGGQERAAATYRASLAQQRQQGLQLAADQQQASVTLADLQSDQSAANATMAAQRQTLAQVKGHLAALVAEAQAAQQQAEQAAVETSVARQDQAPQSAPPSRVAPSPTATATSEPLPDGPSPTAPPTPPTTAGATTTTSPTTTVPTPPGQNTAAPGSNLAIAYARQQLGKPYQWGGAGPNSFDCSGLVMMAWEQAGVYFPHLAQDQYDMTERISIADLLPGDLVFYGTPDNVYHVGLYIGNGQMIDAPATGQDVSIQSIYNDGLLGGGRVES